MLHVEDEAAELPFDVALFDAGLIGSLPTLGGMLLG
jgi:hypothetical protein